MNNGVPQVGMGDAEAFAKQWRYRSNPNMPDGVGIIVMLKDIELRFAVDFANAALQLALARLIQELQEAKKKVVLE